VDASHLVLSPKQAKRAQSREKQRKAAADKAAGQASSTSELTLEPSPQEAAPAVSPSVLTDGAILRAPSPSARAGEGWRGRVSAGHNMPPTAANKAAAEQAAADKAAAEKQNTVVVQEEAPEVFVDTQHP
jgi:hypothetical protein